MREPNKFEKFVMNSCRRCVSASDLSDVERIIVKKFGRTKRKVYSRRIDRFDNILGTMSSSMQALTANALV